MLRRTLSLFCLLMPLLLLAPACNKADSKGDKTADSTGTANADNAGGADANAQKTQLKFDKISHDFGKIKEGDKVKYKFEFTNTGNNPAKVASVKPSCGCTASNFTKDPVQPGDKGFVELEFDSKGKKGKQTKTATVQANTDEPIIITLVGEVTE